MGRHKNSRQETVLVHFMQEYQDLASGKMQNKELRNVLWTKLAERLNNHGPPKKSPGSWKKVWFDWRSSVKRKVLYDKNDALTAVEYDNVTYKKTLSGAESAVARICGFFDADIEDKYIEMQDDLSRYSEGGAANIIKEELMFDGEKEENPLECDIASLVSEEIETECANVSSAQCQADEIKIEVEDYEENIVSKKRRLSPENEEAEEHKGLVDLMKQQTKVISTVSHFINENVNIHEENLHVLKSIQQGLKEMSDSINKLSGVTNEKLKEQRRHNYEMEKLRREEILLQKQQLQLNELKTFNNKELENI